MNKVKNIEVEARITYPRQPWVVSEKEALYIDCIKATVEKIKESKQYNLSNINKALVFGCVKEIIKSKLLDKIVNERGSYGNFVRKSLNKLKTKDIIKVLKNELGFSDKEIIETITFIPKKYIDDLTDEIEFPYE